ncbi:hypothetical protein [Chthonobacter rhizosphaerae]|uniref:hypothetical protein n=1 Tax=Chthonobacter rhizosphaerae TaxID=2735553 RepID=UPI0015EF88D6|nr:hypothetical protein [Chthonobacter rhizosphaerae]
MTISMHPRMRSRLDRIERERTLAADRAFLTSIDEVETLATTMESQIGRSLTEAVLDTCRVLRRSMDTHDPDSPAGAIIRRFLPLRLDELRLVCQESAVMLSERQLADA